MHRPHVPVILASGSASRAQLLRNAGVEPRISPVEVNEEAILSSHSGTAQGALLTLAWAKATAHGPVEGAVVIAADSMLRIDGELQGKPHTESETIRRWRAQSGKTGELMTAHVFLYGNESYAEVSTTSITFGRPSEADIAAYAASGEPWGCAGAFTLEALGSWFIDRIEGDPSGVIGLSMPVVGRALTHFGIDVSQTWVASKR